MSREEAEAEARAEARATRQLWIALMAVAILFGLAGYA